MSGFKFKHLSFLKKILVVEGHISSILEPTNVQDYSENKICTDTSLFLFAASELTMVMIMPKKVGDFSSLSDQDIKDALAKVAGTYRRPVPCQLNVPKFKVRLS